MDLTKSPRCAGNLKPVFSSSGRTELRCSNCEEITVERAAPETRLTKRKLAAKSRMMRG